MSTTVVYYEHYCIPAMNLIFGIHVFMYRKMSEQMEEFDVLDSAEATEESEDLYDTIKIPVISEEPPESDQTEDNDSDQELSVDGLEPPAKGQSDQSSSSLASNEEQVHMEEVMPSEQVADHKLTEFDKTKQYSNDYQTLMEKIKTVRESLRTSVIDSTATGITQGR